MSASITPDGIPVINGKPAQPCACSTKADGGLCRAMGGVFIAYLCPECNAHLSASGICLNACHLSAAAERRFQQSLRESAALTTPTPAELESRARAQPKRGW